MVDDKDSTRPVQLRGTERVGTRPYAQGDRCNLQAGCGEAGIRMGLGDRLVAPERALELLLHSYAANGDIKREEKKITGGRGAEGGAGTRSVRTQISW